MDLLAGLFPHGELEVGFLERFHELISTHMGHFAQTNPDNIQIMTIRTRDDQLYSHKSAYDGAEALSVRGYSPAFRSVRLTRETLPGQPPLSKPIAHLQLSRPLA